jgi:transposase
MYEEDGLCIKCIAHMFDVPYATAKDVIRRRSWKHLTALPGE